MHHRRLPGGPSYTFNLLAQTRQSSGREKTLAGRRGKRGEREGGCSADKSSHVVNDVHLHYLPSSLGLIDAVIHHCYRATTDGGGGEEVSPIFRVSRRDAATRMQQPILAS